MTHVRFILRLLRAVALIASALLMLAAVAGWIRSHFVGDAVMRTVMWGYSAELVTDDMLSFEHGAGEFAIFHVRLSRRGVGADPTAGLGKRVNWTHVTGPPEPLSANWLKQVKVGIGGYGYVRAPLPPGQGVVPPGITGVCLPYWFVFAATAVAPAWWLLAFRRRRRAARRIARGCCPACGYDVRASPQRCPECGHAVHIDSNTSIAPAGPA